jgi:hypothetical protein
VVLNRCKSVIEILRINSTAFDAVFIEIQTDTSIQIYRENRIHFPDELKRFVWGPESNGTVQISGHSE